MKSTGYVAQLDGLRFVAILMVMIAHWMQWRYTNPLVLSFPFSHGVLLFFVLSGFLITRILLENRDKYEPASRSKFLLLKNFYARRVLRIFPIYYGTIFFLLLINYKNTAEIFPWLVTYSSNILESITNEYVGDFNHFWSLAVEEQFYLFWPLLIIFIKPKYTKYVILGAILTAFITRIYLSLYVGNWMANSYFTLSCMYSLGLGALLAYLNIYHLPVFERLARRSILYGVLVIYLVLLFLQMKFKISWYKEIVEDFSFSVLSGIIIVIASTNGFKGLIKYFLELKFVVYSGKISYGMYVYHLFIPALFYYLAPIAGLSISNKYTLFIAFYLLTFLLSHYSWKLIESPINNYKKHFPYFK